MKRLLAINGSYREDGITDQAVDAALEAATRAGARVESVRLRDIPIGFCLNCRQCTQVPGEMPGTCVQNDRMSELVDMIEASDGYILASPVNFYSVTALFKRFMERLIVYAYWPWNSPAPKLRKRRATKKAMLIVAGAAPSVVGRLFFSNVKQLKLIATVIGARPIGSVWIGLGGSSAHPVLTDLGRRRVQRLAAKLAR